MVPETFTGKVLSSFCCICGIIFIALPTSVVSNKFSVINSEQRRMDLIKKFKEQTKISIPNLFQDTQETNKDIK